MVAMPTRRERVVPRLIEEEMRDSFLDYSMSVIVQRALPDVRDGLKPVHRRILYAMHEAGLVSNRPHKKSATVVGDVLGKYHPHGDMAVYEAMVRMVQDFAMRHPLVDGQGNFGSIDGDNAAAYRYTEARLSGIAMELLQDIDKGTVDYAPNFDDRLEEPTVLPAKFPVLLVNGSSGIAVGMATNIPPHNLGEIANALKHLIADPDVTVDELMEHVPGPDFPTGAFMLGRDGIADAYRTGRGRIVMRAAVQKETRRGGKEQLVVTALPYGVSKSKVIEQIATVARGGKADDIADLRDESDRDGMRIVIELKRGAKPKPILDVLYKQTYLQATFGAIMLALDHGVPRELTLKEMLERFRDHRVDVIVRRARHDLEKARAEAHIVQGLLIALEYIDEVISIIRASADQEEAARALCNSFELSEIQAKAILAMRLGRLTALETDDLKKQLAELRKQIRGLEEVLGSEVRQLQVLVEELDEVVSKFANERRTTIVDDVGEYEVEDLVAEESVVITLSHEHYIKRVPIGLYRRRVASGRAIAGMDRHEEDFLEHVFVASSQDTLVFFTQSGQAYALAVADVPEAGPSSRGRALAQLLTFERGDRIAALLPVTEFTADRSLLFLTSSGTVKRTSLDQYSNIRSGGINAIKVVEGDRLLDVQVAEGLNDVVLVTEQGRAIRFPETDVPEMGRVAQGVKGIQLRAGDAVVGMVVVRREAALCTVTARGFAKRTPVSDYPSQKRGGLGTITLDVSARTGPLVAAKEVLDGDELMLITAAGSALRVIGADIPVQGRATQGKKVVEINAADRVVEVSRVAREDSGPPRRAVAEDAPEVEPDDGAAQLDLMR